VTVRRTAARLVVAGFTKGPSELGSDCAPK
jgi:hypothetical protein